MVMNTKLIPSLLYQFIPIGLNYSADFKGHFLYNSFSAATIAFQHVFEKGKSPALS